MVTVNCWFTNIATKAVGHASIDVNGTYMSWWPSEGVGLKSGSVYPATMRKLQDDIDNEEGKIPSVVSISNLNEAKMIDWWKRFGVAAIPSNPYYGPPQAYNLWRNNCCNIVMSALKAGLPEKYDNSKDFLFGTTVENPYGVWLSATAIKALVG